MPFLPNGHVGPRAKVELETILKYAFSFGGLVFLLTSMPMYMTDKLNPFTFWSLILSSFALVPLCQFWVGPNLKAYKEWEAGDISLRWSLLPAVLVGIVPLIPLAASLALS